METVRVFNSKGSVVPSTIDHSTIDMLDINFLLFALCVFLPVRTPTSWAWVRQSSSRSESDMALGLSILVCVRFCVDWEMTEWITVKTMVRDTFVLRVVCGLIHACVLATGKDSRWQ